MSGVNSIPAPGQTGQRQASPTSVMVISLIICIVDCFMLLGTGFLILFGLPKFEQIFEDFETELPTLTVLVLSVPAAVWALILLVFVMGLAVKEGLIRNKHLTLIINGAVFPFVVGGIFLLVIAIILPIFKLFESVT